MGGGSPYVQGILQTGSGSVNVRDIIYNSVAPPPPPPPPSAPTLIESLNFERIRFRESAIENPHEGTCRWLLDTPEYKQWMATDPVTWSDGLLWIKGNPGAGKSTIMKFAVEHGRSSTPNTQGLVLPHFFNARGTDVLEYSTEGLYRTLLVWLLEELAAESVAELEKRFLRHNTGHWSVPELARMLKAAVGHLRSVPATFYVDALDECRTEEVRKMLLVFADIVKQAWISHRKIRVCFASRPYPQITFRDAIFLEISKQTPHLEDIVKYIGSCLDIGNSVTAREIKSQLCHKAGGIFMWAVLVVNLLNAEYDKGNIYELQHQLEEIPAGLHELLAYTLHRHPENQEMLLLCFRWLIFSQSEGEILEFWWAMQRGLGSSDEDISRKMRGMEYADMERFIVDKSKGFIEVVHRYGSRQAQFIHESVRDFIFKESQVQRLYGARDSVDFEGQSHEMLRDWCVAELGARRVQIMEAVARRGEVDLDLDDFKGWDTMDPPDMPEFPFAMYAVRHIWTHVQEAQQRGRDQTVFLNTISDRTGPYFLSDRFPRRGRPLRAVRSSISLLLDQDCSTLIRETQLQAAQSARAAGHAFGVCEYSSLLSRSLYDADPDRTACVLALADIYLRMEHRHPQLQELLEGLARRISSGYRSVDFTSSSGYSPLLNLTRFNGVLASFFLLVLPPSSALEPHLSTIRSWASSLAPVPLFAQIVKLFIEQQVHVVGWEIVDYRTLQWAVHQESKVSAKGDKHEEVDEDAREIYVQLGNVLRDLGVEAKGS